MLALLPKSPPRVILYAPGVSVILAFAANEPVKTISPSSVKAGVFEPVLQPNVRLPKL